MVPNDPYLTYQNHLWQIGNLEAIWQDYSGDGVRIGIYDTGVDAGHPELLSNYDASLHYDGVFGRDTPTEDLISASAAHGTAVAGVIAASANNGEGIAGLAYEAKITGVSYISQFYDKRDERTALVDHGHVFDVVNFSVNYNNAALYYSSDHNIFAPLEGGEAFPSIGASHLRSFRHLVSEGREGLGTVIVKAVGNNTVSAITPFPDGNAAGDSLNTPHETIVVSALDHFGEADPSVRFGTNVLLAAPMALFTTDVSGDGGSVTEGEGSTFGPDYSFGLTRGSSFSAPVVSGAVALMLEANPTLGWRDVQHILAASAQDAGQLQDTAHGFGWREASAGTFNGGGFLTHNSFGYGRLDVHAAVRMAEAWAAMSPEAATSDGLHRLTAADGAEHSFGSDGLSWAIDVTEQMDIEYIYVNFDLVHDDLSALNLTLVAPDGTRFALLQGYSYARDVESEVTFGIAHARGMDAAGRWQLEVTTQADSLGQMGDLTLIFEGEQDGAADDIHHITDAIWHLTAEDTTTVSDRTMLSDTNGGTDWLDLSAFTGHAVVDLSSGDIALAGEADGREMTRRLTLADAAGFEHVHGGNGDDRLIGSLGDETLIGGHGNDLLVGGAGADHLVGGQGHDRASYAEAGSAIGLNRLATHNSGDAAGDRLDGIEALEGSAFDDDIRGHHQRDVLMGGAGDDWIMGQNGRDLLIGDDGNDVLLGGKHADDLRGGAGDDRLVGGSGDDRLVDQLGDNMFLGGDGHDVIIDGVGHSIIRAGSGDDTVNGHAGDDYIQGGAGQDVLSGSDGRDTLVGESGNDILIGDDSATLKRTGDIFVFAPGMGVDRILDFNPNEGDIIRLDAALLGDWPDSAALLDHQARQDGGDVVIDVAPGHSLHLDGVSDIGALLGAIEVV